MDSFGILQTKRQRHYWVEGQVNNIQQAPSPKLAAAPVVVPPHQLCWRGQHRGLCFGGNRSLWWDPFGALWFKIQDAELIFTALSRGATSLLISRWRLSNQGSPQPAPAALVGLTGLWSTWEATEQAETLGFKPHSASSLYFSPLCVCVCGHRLMPMMTAVS